MVVLDWPVLWRAVGVGLALMALAVLVSVTPLDDGLENGRTWLLLALTVGSLTAAGAVAGWQRSDRPLRYGALAAVATGGLVLVVGSAVRLAVGDGFDGAAVVVALSLSLTCGLAGGLLGDWARRRNRRRQRS